MYVVAVTSLNYRYSTKHLSLRAVSVSKLVETPCVKWGLWCHSRLRKRKVQKRRQRMLQRRYNIHTHTHAQVNGDLHHTEWGGGGSWPPKVLPRPP